MNEQGARPLYPLERFPALRERLLNRSKTNEHVTDDEGFEVVVSAFGLDHAAKEALFDRVADAAHALDEQVTCSSSVLHPARAVVVADPAEWSCRDCGATGSLSDSVTHRCVAAAVAADPADTGR